MLVWLDMGKLQRAVGGDNETWEAARAAVYDSLNKLKHLDKTKYYKLILAIGEYASDKIIDQLTLKDPAALEVLAKAEKIPVMYGPHSDYRKSAEVIIEKLAVGTKALVRQTYKTKSISVLDTEKTDNLKNRLAKSAINTVLALRKNRPVSEYHESIKYLKSIKASAIDIKRMMVNVENDCIYSEELLDRIERLKDPSPKTTPKEYQAWAACTWDVLVTENNGKVPQALLDKAAYAEIYALDLAYHCYADIPPGTKLSKVKTRAKMDFKRLVNKLLNIS